VRKIVPKHTGTSGIKSLIALNFLLIALYFGLKLSPNRTKFSSLFLFFPTLTRTIFGSNKNSKGLLIALFTIRTILVYMISYMTYVVFFSLFAVLYYNIYYFIRSISYIHMCVCNTRSLKTKIYSNFHLLKRFQSVKKVHFSISKCQVLQNLSGHPVL